jgi:hypothetical protein
MFLAMVGAKQAVAHLRVSWGFGANLKNSANKY